MAISASTKTSTGPTTYDRMPVIIRPEHYAAWLDPTIQDPATVMMLAEPFPTQRLTAYAVGTRVNRPGEERAALVEPAT